ncbi:MAG: aminotransferase class IV [Alphaproteobacteria bacterium]|uniref:branched-chain-amino-acid transaminase n=1 Tax=Candidatus Nitrobium versatile TaxID=2884831 RepID=A0A953M0M6_9BACT|nr:aminotransferase class IV [Candidatus Nitrobium versatile]
MNDRVVPAAEAKVSVFDHGFLYGDGIYETMRVYDGVVFLLDEHLQRLHRSASLIGLDIPKDVPGIKRALYDTLQANALRNAYVRLTVSRGYGQIGLDPDLCKEPTFIIITNEFKPYPNTLYENGISLLIASTRRNLKEALDPRIKSLNFLNNILAKIEAKRADAYEAVMLNDAGHLAEGTISNLFFVKEGVLCTPSLECGILDGITRSLIIDLAVRNSIGLREGAFLPGDLYRASEVFVTNSTMEVMPVSRVDSSRFTVGYVTRLLHTHYKHEVNAYVSEKKGEGPSLWQ